ncbi:MAG: ABC transporter permease [Gemmatimonadetes bacterium]|nr:ABC transporter permease [Gemmatimonadota bacterium]
MGQKRKRRVDPGKFIPGPDGVAGVFKPALRDEVEEELDFHVAMRAREFEAEGMSPEDAERQARARLQNYPQMVSELEGIGRRRDAAMAVQERWGEWVRDGKYALRQLRRAPGFALVAILTLALGIGANTAVFSVINGVLLEPLPYEEPDELIVLSSAFPTMDFDRFWLSPPEYFELREWNQVFEEIGGYRTGTASIETADRPVRVPSAVATWTLFPTLGVSAALGRTFTEQEDLPGADPVAMISDGLWRRAFAADPSVIGRNVRLGGIQTTIVGVLPAGFDMEDAGVDVWTPANLDPSDHSSRRGNHFLVVVGRANPGVPIERVQADLDRLEVRWQEEYGDTHAPSAEFHPMSAYDFREDIVGDIRPAMMLLLGAVAFVLLIACANVANLLLARSETRSKEVAVRVAMGAGRRRMVKQLLTEGVTLALAGALAGLVVGHFALQGLLRVNPDGVPRSDVIGLDWKVGLFTAAVALATGVIFGLAPLINTTLSRVGSTLKEGGTRSTKGSAGLRARRLMVIAEVALAVILVTGSGLMLRSMSALQQVDVGFQPEGLLTMQVSLPQADYPTAVEVGAFFESALERIRALPGVESATVTSGLPPLMTLNANDTEFEGVQRVEDGPAHNVDYWTSVDSDYLETMGARLLEGRAFTPSDALAETPVMMVNERLARTFYPGSSPVGRRIRPPGQDNPWFNVIGVVADIKQAGVNNDAGTQLFFYGPQLTQGGLFAYRTQDFVVRTSGEPLSLSAPVRRVLSEMDPALPVSDIQTMQENVARTMAQPRFMTLLLALFAGVALLLAAVGTYGVMSYSVAERYREIGIRMAMGAERRTVLGLVLRQGGLLAIVGVVLGVGGALGLTRFLQSQLYEVSATDPRTFVLAPAFLAFVALLACFVPAQRATRVDPVTALRED